MLDDLAQSLAARVRADRYLNLAASSRLARFSLTPATRHASICMTSMARAWRNCLNTTRLAACSPLATLTGRTTCLIAATPRVSPGLVGSSEPQEVVGGLSRSPDMPPSTARAVPVVAPASGLAR